MPGDLDGDGGDLGRSFAQAQHNFGESLPVYPVVVDTCEAQVRERFLPKRADQSVFGRRRVDSALGDITEQGAKLSGRHD